MKKKILLGLLAILVIIQFIQPKRNDSETEPYHAYVMFPISNEAKEVLRVACNDCHTNKTVYPWYANIQPVAWWLSSHVNGGKKHLNFSEFTNLPVAVQFHKFEEILEVVKEKKMPISSYTWLGLHGEAKLTDDQRKSIVDWAEGSMVYLRSNNPPDSLVMKKRG